jgi:hypothetical protein
LASECGFVAVSGAHVMATFFDSEAILPEIGISETFVKALKLAVSRLPEEDLERIEAALLLIRFFIHKWKSVPQIVPAIKDNEELLFLSFQRHIEHNHSYVCLNFFLFIHALSGFFKHWIPRLRGLVLDSQFSALIAHILGSSGNRSAIQDCMTALRIMTEGIAAKNIDIDSVLTDVLISGFYAVNRERLEENDKRTQRIKSIQNDCFSRILEMNVERELCRKETLALREHSDQSNAKNSSDELRIQDLESENEILRQCLNEKKELCARLSSELKSATHEKEELSFQLSHRDEVSGIYTEKSARMKAKLAALKRSENEQEQLHKSFTTVNDRLAKTTRLLEEKTEELDRVMEMAKAERAKRKEVQQLLSVSQDRVNKLAEQWNTQGIRCEFMEKERKGFKRALRNRVQEEAETAETIVKMNRELELIVGEKEGLERENQRLCRSLAEMKEKVDRLVKDKKELLALTKLVYRVTDGSSENVDSLLADVNRDLSR